MKSFVFSTVFSLFFSVSWAYGAETTCFEFPVRSDMAREASPKSGSEKWCYQENFVTNETFIFNADENKVRAEQAILVDHNGILTHGSLLNGKMTIHKVNSRDFNPYSVPLTAPTDLAKAFIPSENFKSLLASAKTVLDLFKKSSAKVETFENNSVSPLISAAKLPWRGYWWPRRNMPMVPPLIKYDKFVGPREGNPGAAAWERVNHAYKGVNWEGHCNGWAASAILRNEPRVSRTDALSGTTFSISDQKALLAELDYCVSISFFGNRNYGAGNNGDIRPELFHKTVLYYIGALRKSVIMDYRSDASVDNHIVSGYTMQMQQVSANRKIVTARMTFHGYDKSITNTPGIAPRYTRVYKYYLNTDSNGNPVGGSWISGNPDFIWVPLSPARCNSNNPRITNSWVTNILSI